MLTPKYLEALPQSMIQLYSRLENEIIEDVAKRISKANFLTPTAEWRLYKAEQLRLSSKQITAKLARLTGKSEKEIRKLYTAALKEALKNDEKIYRAAINEGYLSEDKNGVLNSYFGSVAFSNALKAGLQNTNGLMRNLCSSTAASANRLLSDELDLAFMKITSGAFTMDEAVFSAVKRLGSSGLTVVNYASGRKDKVDVAVRRAVLTGIGQAAANVQLGLAADMGCDLVEVTAHLGARPTHQVWQGRIFSLSGKHPKYPEFRSSTGYGTGDGLCGWNCRHSFYPYFEGLSKPVGVPFTKEENDKVYRDTQKQRAYERAIRQSKRELAALDASRSAASDDDALKQKLDREFQRKAVVLKRREAKLAEHLKASGLLPDNSRVRVDGFGRSVSGKAVWAARKQLTSVVGSGIMNVNQVYSLWDIPGIKKLSESDVRTLDEIVSVIPPKILSKIESYISEVEIIPNLNYCCFKRDNRHLILDPKGMNDCIIHEYGHVLAEILNLYNDKNFLNILADGLDYQDWSNVISISDPTNPGTYIYLLKSPKFIDDYQGRIYTDIFTADYSAPIPLESLFEYFSVGFEAYFKNPNELIKKDRKLYNYIEELMKDG